MTLRLLGPLEAEVDGHALDLGGPKPRALVAILALEVGRVVSVDRLVEDLWPGTPPPTAAHAVQVYVSQLRKALERRISRRGLGYLLELEPDDIDVHRFARLLHEGHELLRAANPAAAADTLREALALWRGPALADFAYEPFAQAEIARLDDQRFGALEDRIEADLALGRHGELVTEIEALVEAQPLRERPRALLMRALYLAGRQADALAVYRATRERLVDELGLEPGQELRDLESAILRQDASLAPARREASAPIRMRRLAAVLSVGTLDRDDVDVEVEDRELEELAEAVAAATARHGGLTQRLADGSVLAVFGVPVAHEDDPLRAARAAVDVRDALAATDSALLTGAIDVGEIVSAESSVSGSPVRSASRLRPLAGSGEVLVSAAAARRIAHAARLEPRGEVFALVEVAPAAPAFARRLDTPLVGRRRELRALRDGLRRTKQRGIAGAALIVGPAGIGKSRLALEVARRTRGVGTLVGRCLSYGDGITYWPLREMLGQASASTERSAVLAALDADRPPPAAEIALLFRRLCEAIAREKPLILVFDDVQWAEPTLLDLVDHVVARGEGPILVVCAAREELLEERPDFLGAHENAERVPLNSLSGEETEELLEDLGGSILDPAQQARIVETAEGNPFFLEQLVALALEGGLFERALPETVQALLAARLDRLGPGERAALERGSVVGREFTADDVVALLEPAAVPTAEAHLETLSARGFLRTREEDSYAFRHALLQEAVYRAAPKRLRAELHERFADRLDDAYTSLPELDELVGYHLEQAYRLRTELGESDRRVESLAEDAGRRLGEAGVRALKRSDVPASAGLLLRATSLVPPGVPPREDLLCELGITLDASGRPEEACEMFELAIQEASARGELRVALRARMELEYVRLPRITGATADALLEAASAAIPVLEAAGDYRCLGRAWLFVGWVHGGRRGRHKEREEAAEKALAYYKRSTWPTATSAGEIACSLHYGPTPVPAAIARCEALLADEITTRHGRANVESYLGGLVAQRGDVVEARRLLASARTTYEGLGHRASTVTFSGVILGEVELMAGEEKAAEETLRWVCNELSRTHAYSRLASRAGDLAQALYRQGRFDEAAEWVALAEQHSAADDVDARVLWTPVAAKLAARRGELDEAIRIASRAVEVAEASDALNRRASVWADVAEIQGIAGNVLDATSALERALSLYEEKRNVLCASRLRAALDNRTHA